MFVSSVVHFGNVIVTMLTSYFFFITTIKIVGGKIVGTMNFKFQLFYCSSFNFIQGNSKLELFSKF